MRSVVRRVSVALLLTVALVAIACAPRTAVTQWGYSSWFRRGATGEMGTFHRQRDKCLAEAGVANPESIAADSPEEDGFIRCMNRAEWCSRAFHCQKPGV
jgi:hypothetical protein